MTTLYVYDHCPYCVKARMIFGLKNIPFKLNIIPNDDEPTPVSMVGKKMMPILKKKDGGFIPESMDIVHYIDRQYGPEILTGPTNPQIDKWLNTVGVYLNHLLMPRYVKSDLAEFPTRAARDYYQAKKEAVIGSFADNLAKTPELVKKANCDLFALSDLLESEHACNGALSTDDIHLFPALRGLSIVKGVNYLPKVDAYRKRMAQKSQINLFDDIAI